MNNGSDFSSSLITSIKTFLVSILTAHSRGIVKKKANNKQTPKTEKEHLRGLLMGPLYSQLGAVNCTPTTCRQRT